MHFIKLTIRVYLKMIYAMGDIIKFKQLSYFTFVQNLANHNQLFARLCCIFKYIDHTLFQIYLSITYNFAIIINNSFYIYNFVRYPPFIEKTCLGTSVSRDAPHVIHLGLSTSMDLYRWFGDMIWLYIYLYVCVCETIK